MIPYQVMVVKATGIPLRAGRVDFTTDGVFDPATQEIRTDSPVPVRVQYQEGQSRMDKYDRAAGSWIDVPMPVDPDVTDRKAIEAKLSAGTATLAEIMRYLVLRNRL